MARKATLLQCLLETESHVLPHRAAIVLEMDPLGDLLAQQFHKISIEAKTALQQIKKIEEVATARGYQDIVAVLNEEVDLDYGATE